MKIPFYIITCFFLFISLTTKAQKDTTIALHFQQTTITQTHPAFKALYSGENSLNPGKETATSVTSTLFLGKKLWKESFLYINPEMAGGSGFSSTMGIAGFPNGETFRVGNPAPTIYVARFALRQYFKLGSSKEEQIEKDQNEISRKIPSNRITLTVGKFSIADIFDFNTYSHDPRNHFFNWSLMSNGAWDYPANTRGYTWGGAIEIKQNTFTFRLASVLVPKEANGAVMDLNINKARGDVLEVEKSYLKGSEKGFIRLLVFHNEGHMGNYQKASLLYKPEIQATRQYTRHKYGAGINIEYPFSENSGMFIRASWNDGKNETWAFTEIDHSFSTGFVTSPFFARRNKDVLGIALAFNGISKEHEEYFTKGGSGFMLGDGKLNYSPEIILEGYYLVMVHHFVHLTPDYQFILNPGYNKDRGPVQVYGIRTHFEF